MLLGAGCAAVGDIPATQRSSPEMRISSPAFDEGVVIPTEYTCDGAGSVPPLRLLDVPAEAKSLALIMHDPDASSAEFVRWTAWNLPSDTAELLGDPPASAVQGVNGAGKRGYVGPCPPSGTHRYVFTLYALDTMLSLPITAGAKELRAAVTGHTLHTATLTGLYKRTPNP